MMRWLIYLMIHMVARLISIPLAPLAILFFSSDDKRHLTFFKWLETIDNDLSGDDGWKKVHITGDPLSTWNRIGWLWRNGGNALNYGLLGCDFHPYDLTNTINPIFWKRPDGYWIFRKFWQITNIRQLEIFIGWALYGPQRRRCKFVCTIRFPSITK